MRMSDDSLIPSDAELKLLRQLWWGGELSVRELHDRVRTKWPVGYTTVLKLLQRMHAKGLVTRRRDGRAHVYRAVHGEAALERRMARDFLARVFDGSVERLVSRALPEEAASAEELAEIQRLLRRMEP
jgi:predicted transcriptional regulator